MGLDTNPHAEGIIGAAVSLFFAGGFFGAITTSYVAGHFDRKGAIGMASVIVLIAGALCAVSIATFMVFRFFSGLGNFTIAISVPMWIAELSLPTSRGILAGVHAVMANIGYTASACIGVGFYYYQSNPAVQ
jgi:MFS family permease